MDKLLILKLFSLEYFVYLLLALAIILAMVMFFRNLDEEKQTKLKVLLIAVMGIFIILEYIGRVVALEKFVLCDQLPIESYHIFFVISLIMIIKKSMRWQRFAYLIMLPISAFSILFPSVQYLVSPAFSLQVISYMIANISIFALSLMCTIWQPKEVEFKDIFIASTDFAIIIGVVHIINVFLRFTAWGLHANYFGTMGEDYNEVIGFLFDIIPVSFVCIIPLLALLVGLEFLMVFPIHKNQALQDRREKLEELVALGNMKAQQEYRQEKMKNKSQILLRSETKAIPEQSKNVTNKSTSGFVSSVKEVKTNNEDVRK